LFDRLWPEHVVDTLGWKDNRFSLGDNRKHIEFELNDSYYPEKWPKVSDGYNIIVMAEVIEHLYTAPVQVLRCLRSLLAPGGFLIVTTPNAAALQQRLQCFSGEFPTK
jgi:2-polyprenyl-3-methyl-5-hydroxy-6-metoxy-1,4-benzoquinol methylase